MTATRLSDEQWHTLLNTRAKTPGAVAAAYAARRRAPALLSAKDSLFLVAADHPARGALAAGPDPMAMADRRSLLARMMTALEHPEVDGVLGTPDIVEELLLLGALEGKIEAGLTARPGPWMTGLRAMTRRASQPTVLTAAKCCCASTIKTRALRPLSKRARRRFQNSPTMA